MSTLVPVAAHQRCRTVWEVRTGAGAIVVKRIEEGEVAVARSVILMSVPEVSTAET